MVKFIKYHLLYLFNDLWLLLSVIMIIISGFLFYYLGYGFDSSLLRLLETNEYLLEFENEAFLICNIILSIWIIGASKEMFTLEEDHVMLINKKRYKKSKIIAYLLYYCFISLLLYGVYQIITVSLYGLRPFNYRFIIHLIINVCLVHLVVVFASGRNKNIFLTMIYILIFLIFNTLTTIDFYRKDLLMLFLPIQTLNHPANGYLHVLFVLLIIYLIGCYKHISYYE